MSHNALPLDNLDANYHIAPLPWRQTLETRARRRYVNNVRKLYLPSPAGGRGAGGEG